MTIDLAAGGSFLLSDGMVFEGGAGVQTDALTLRGTAGSNIFVLASGTASIDGLAVRFANVGATKVLTAEISGIAPALMTACYLHIPVVYARKTKPITMPDQVFLTLAPSHTKGRMVELIISPEYLAGGEKILIIDDFLATGATIMGLVRLAQTAGSEVVGIGALIEKTFEGGREVLAPLGIPVESLVCITSMKDGQVTFGKCGN